MHQQGSPRPVPGLGQLLRGHHPEREAGVDDLAGKLLRRAHAPRGDLPEPDLPHVRHPLVQRVEDAPLEQVGRVDGVARGTEFVGEGDHPGGQTLDVVEQYDLCHAGTPRL